MRQPHQQPHQPPYRFLDQNGIRLCLYTLFDGRQVRAACAYGPAGLAGDFGPDENRAVCFGGFTDKLNPADNRAIPAN